MVATSTLKTKNSDCVSELVERRYDQVCIEKGGFTVVFFLVCFSFFVWDLVAGAFQLYARFFVWGSAAAVRRAGTLSVQQLSGFIYA